MPLTYATVAPGAISLDDPSPRRPRLDRGTGIYASLDDLPIGLDMFRKAGGKRAILANIFTDLRPDPPAHPLIAHAKTTLVCRKSEARDRLRRIADLGFDDALMIVPFGVPEMLDGIRDLLP